MSVGFAAQHRADRWFFILFVAVGWWAIYMGFAGEMAKRFAGKADYAAPPILIMHIFSFLGWMILPTVQVLLIRFRGHRLHQRLGITLTVLAPIMVLSGIGAEIVSQRFYSVKQPANFGFFAFPLIQMLTFAPLAAGAWIWRRDPSTHKRLILSATSVILTAAYFRWFGDKIFDTLGEGIAGRWMANYVGPDLMLTSALFYDLATRRSVQRAWWFATPLILAGQAAAVALSFNHPWRGIVRWLVGL